MKTFNPVSKYLSFFLFVTLFPLVASSSDLNGVNMPESVVTANNKTLLLNGMGARKKSIITVYVAGLYLESKSKDPASILQNQNLTKRIDMQFVLSWLHPKAEKNEIMNTFKEGLEKNCGQDCGAAEEVYRKLEPLITDMINGDKLSFTFNPNSFEVTVKGKAYPEIEGASASKVLLSIFLGDNPPTEDLKKGLLGLR